ncbi:glycosyltransferase family 8 protein [Helicobacter muridarum]|uniref:Glycosyltransferase family 8 protein n=1 Tax=Helicobacter muridarum TaxID=216 RepID=A0A377PVS1_9HELI|nr:glycosyltransferase family 8 protein [Helicobacter muridarum]TLE00844.1 glycosyltransferase family 8 protein [Helicobacter muridarum]STQ86610.1 lipopolysaccharide 1,3-galactosyltransferase [Helicobacter muridarum]
MADNIKDSNLIFHIILDYISASNSYKIQLLESMLGVKIKIDIINPDIFQDLIPWGEGKNYTTYYRLKIASFLPVNVSKCIYLDCDMICNADIRDLFFTDLNGHICGVVGDVRTSYEPMWEIEDKNFSIRTKYSFNAGLLLIDMDKWRIQNIESKLFSLLKDVRLTDQDALNIVFNDDILLIDPRWNCIPVLLQFKPSTAWHHIFSDEATQNIKPTTSFTRYEYENICKEAKIIHFAGPKPWQKRAYDSPNTNMWNLKRWYFRLWWLNAACTPFYKDITYKTLELKKSIYDTIKLPEKAIRALIKYIGNLLFKNF